MIYTLEGFSSPIYLYVIWIWHFCQDDLVNCVVAISMLRSLTVFFFSLNDSQISYQQIRTYSLKKNGCSSTRKIYYTKKIYEYSFPCILIYRFMIEWTSQLIHFFQKRISNTACIKPGCTVACNSVFDSKSKKKNNKIRESFFSFFWLIFNI